MTLCDAGPLIALLDAGDKNHQACRTALSSLKKPLLTTWPCLTEALYLLGRYGGYKAQEKLWTLVESGIVTLHFTSDLERGWMHILMRQYRDVPMDLADASLVAAAEALKLSRIFTTDSHFHAYRISSTESFEVIP